MSKDLARNLHRFGADVGQQCVARRSQADGQGFELMMTKLAHERLAQAIRSATVAETVVGRQFTDKCIEIFMRGELDAVDAALAKMWLSTMHCKVVDEGLQLFGGWGYSVVVYDPSAICHVRY